MESLPNYNDQIIIISPYKTVKQIESNNEICHQKPTPRQQKNHSSVYNICIKSNKHSYI